MYFDMEPAVEITEKLKVAVKAKLVEMGAFVDDELPDYIMVMVANRKAKNQMASDLELFLGSSSALFTDWLHSTLARLQASTSAGELPMEALQNAVIEAISDSDSSSAAKDQKDYRCRRPPSSTKMNSGGSGGERRSSSAVSVSDENGAKTMTGRPTKQTSYKAPTRDEDVLDMYPEIHGDDLDVEIASAALASRMANGHSLFKRISDEVTSKSTPTAASSKTLQVHPPPSVQGLAPSEPSKSKIATVKPIKRFAGKETRAGAKRRSIVGQVIKKEEELDEQYDPLKPQIGNVASVVRVSRRAYNIPPEMQPKPTIFIKAVQDAQRSVTREAIDKGHAEMSEAKLNSMESSTSQVADVNESPVAPLCSGRKPVDLTDNDDQLADTNVTTSYADSANHSLGTEADDSDLTIDDGADESLSSKGTQFIVTLDGVDSEFVKRIERKQVPDDEPLDESLPYSDSDGLFISAEDGVPTTFIKPVKICLDDEEEEGVIDEEDLMQEDVPDTDSAETDVSNINRAMERCKYWPNCKLGPKCIYYHPTSPCRMFPNCRYGNQCLFIHPDCKFDPDCSKPNCPFVHRKKFGPRIIPVHYITPTGSKSTVLCKYGNRCKNPLCFFKHSKLCTFGDACKRLKCPFDHRKQVDFSRFHWEPTLATAVVSSTAATNDAVDVPVPPKPLS